MKIITDLVTVKDERWCWPISDESATYDALLKEMDLIDIIRPYLKKKGTMVQAGGNCGLFIEPFVLEFENVYTFEPDPINFYCLTMNLPYPNIFKYQACLGHEHKLVPMNDSQTCGATHIDNNNINPTTPMLRIDDLNLQSCDLIQLDTEGFEYYGLIGGLETIRRFKPVLCIEMNSPWARRYGVELSQIDKLLCDDLGYVIKEKHSADVIYVCES
jgi:FkbM family methyltransferase